MRPCRLQRTLALNCYNDAGYRILFIKDIHMGSIHNIFGLVLGINLILVGVVALIAGIVSLARKVVTVKKSTTTA